MCSSPIVPRRYVAAVFQAIPPARLVDWKVLQVQLDRQGPVALEGRAEWKPERVDRQNLEGPVALEGRADWIPDRGLPGGRVAPGDLAPQVHLQIQQGLSGQGNCLHLDRVDPENRVGPGVPGHLAVLGPRAGRMTQNYRRNLRVPWDPEILEDPQDLEDLPHHQDLEDLPHHQGLEDPSRPELLDNL